MKQQRSKALSSSANPQSEIRIPHSENPQSQIRNPQSNDFSRYDQKLEFILRNAARIFALKGYHSTSMRDISRATKVSLAGLYYYCRSKEELLYLIQDNCFGHVLERLERRLSETQDPLAKLRFVIENHLSFFAANMAEMKVLSHEADSLAGEMQEQVNGKKQQYTRLVRRILSEVQSSQAQEDGGAQKIDLTVGTYALFGMMNWIYNWYDPSGKLSVGDLVDNITRLFLNGFLAGAVGYETGHELQFKSKTRRAERLSVWRAPQP
jgi:AcrR family transcriptional regulator